MQQKTLETVLLTGKQLNDFQNKTEKDLHEIKEKLSEHDQKFNTIEGTLEKTLQRLNKVFQRLDNMIQ